MQKQEMWLTKRLENWKPRAQFDVKSNTKYQRWKEQFTIKFSSHICFCSNVYEKKCRTTTKRKQKAQVDKNRKTYVLAAPTCDKAACIFLNNFLHTSFLNTYQSARCFCVIVGSSTAYQTVTHFRQKQNKARSLFLQRQMFFYGSQSIHHQQQILFYHSINNHDS